MTDIEKLRNPDPSSVDVLRARRDVLAAQAGQLVSLATALEELTDPGHETSDLIRTLVYDPNNEPYVPQFAETVKAIQHTDD
jgi:hypothetical protein